VLLGIIVGILVAQPNIDRAMEDLKDARTEYSESMLGIRNTQFSIGGAIYNTTNKELKMDLINTGTAVIEGSVIDIILDGTMASSTGMSARIYPGDKVTLTIKSAVKPASVIAVGPYGISCRLGAEMITSK
jgi:archaellum component FlaF (FlaF/FlaG flagellin family)